MSVILPGILEKEASEIEAKIKSVSPWASQIHIDLLDNKFAQNSSFNDPQFFKQVDQDIFLELHLMVDNPLQYLRLWAEAGFRRFIGHIEKMPDIEEFIAEGQLLGEVGLAIDANTAIEKLTIDLDDLDCLLVMTVKAGLSGQKFMPECLEKVKQLRLKTDIPIEVDGGINEETIKSALAAGANRFVTTSALFANENPKKVYEALTKLAEENRQS